MAETPTSKRLVITPTESVEIVSGDDEALIARGIYAPGGKPPPKHFHPFQDERIEVVSGTLRAVIGGVERTLTAEDEVEVPRGTVHSMWNESPEGSETVWRTSPAGRTEQWFRVLDRLQREGRVNPKGMPGPLAFGVYLTEYRDVFRLAGPDWLLRPLFGLLGEIGRRRGYRV